MSMVVQNNSSAMLALGQLKKNDTSLSKQLKKVSSGMKINSAGDGASEYSISEKMRWHIRALNQETDNVKTGKNMIDLASAAVDRQVEIMRRLHSLAMEATNDTNTDVDRKTLQKEGNQLLDQSEQIACETTYNGIHLLDGREVSKETKWFDADYPYHLNKQPIVALSQLASGDVTPTQGKYQTLTPSTTYDITSLGAGNDYTSIPSDGTFVWNKTSNQVDMVIDDGKGNKVL